MQFLPVVREVEAFVLNLNRYIDPISKRFRHLGARLPMRRFSWRIRLRTLLIAVAILALIFYYVGIPLLEKLIYSPAERKQRAIVAFLERPLDISFPNPTSFEMVLKTIKARTQPLVTPSGIPIYVDPVGLSQAGLTMQSTVVSTSNGAPLKVTLRELLKPLGLSYVVKDGLLLITSQQSVGQYYPAKPKDRGPF